MSSIGHIHFFDIKSISTGPHQTWSPNTIKTRMTLNYKFIPYTESFISYVDIGSVLSTYHIPNDPQQGIPTLPAIVHYGPDGTIIKALGGANDIARYLDSISPDLPVFPPSFPGYSSAYTAFEFGFLKPTLLNSVRKTGFKIVISKIPSILDPPAKEYFIRSRTESSGKRGDLPPMTSPEDWGSADPEDDWIPFLAGLQPLIRVFQKSAPYGPFLWGETPTLLDFEVAAIFAWFMRGNEEDGKRLIGHAEEFERFWKACEGWVWGESKVVEWDVKAGGVMGKE